jgi:hypothetical protein
MHIDELYPSRFLRCSDLDGRPMPVTIAGLKREDIGGEHKSVLVFADDTKELILNKTNARAIAKVFGNETTAWKGKQITLVPTQVDFRGDIVDAIRVRATPRRPGPTPTPQPAPTTPPQSDDMNDSIDF